MTQRRGAALMLAVWLVVVLGAACAAIASATRGSAQLALNLKAEVQARRAAESGVVVAAKEVERALEALRDSVGRSAYLNSLDRRAVGDGGVVLGEARFAYAYVDVNSRLDINSASETQLTRFFEFFSPPAESKAAAAAVRAKVSGTGSSAGIAGQPLRALEELRHIEGVSEDLALKAAPYLTVDGDGRINATSASDTVLGSAGGELAREPSRLLLVSRGWVNGLKLTHEIQALYAVESNRMVLVKWRERDL